MRLKELVDEFKDQLKSTLIDSFPLVDVEFHSYGDINAERYTLQVNFPLNFNPPGGPAYPSGLYSAFVVYNLFLSGRSKNLAVARSCFSLKVGTAPVLRFDYEKEKSSHPAAHLHFTGVGNWLSPALMINRPNKDSRQGKLEALHIPVGGHRFRPSIEEFIYFLIRECGFEGKFGWEERIVVTRDSWRDTQLCAAVRDNPDVAAQTLKSMGYGVSLPEGITPPKKRDLGW